MKAEIISVGTELLLGFIVDTNANWIATELSLLGIDCYHINQVGDNAGRLQTTLQQATKRSDLVILSGGLGPTEDDLTREAVCEWAQEKPEVDVTVLEQVRQVFSRRNIEMPQSNLKQAWKIPSAVVLENPIGTAPGWWVEKNGCVVVIMPGVPSEMKQMWTSQVVPKLKTKVEAEGGKRVLAHRIFKVLGLGESAIEERLKSLLAQTNPSIATYAKQDGVHVRTSASADTLEKANTLLDSFELTVREALGELIYAIEPISLAGTVQSILSSQSRRLVGVEVGTSGALSGLLFSGSQARASDSVFMACYAAHPSFLDEKSKDPWASILANVNLKENDVLLISCLPESQGSAGIFVWRASIRYHLKEQPKGGKSKAVIDWSSTYTGSEQQAGLKVATEALNQVRLFWQHKKA
jgi:nicotinamide-nucleotide amidase